MKWLITMLLLPSLATADVGQANDTFWKGDHADAARAYRVLLEAHPKSADLWFNLGTAEAKADRLGHAMHAFEQALLLRPGDEDAAYNLGKVREAIVERGVAGAGEQRVVPPGEDDTGTGLLTAMSAGLVTGIFAVTWIALFLLLGLWRRATRPAIRTGTSFVALIMGLIALASGGVLLGRIYVLGATDHGVVLERTTVRAGPGKDYAPAATLLGGVKVRLRGADATWRQVVLPNGSEGWLPESRVGALKR